MRKRCTLFMKNILSSRGLALLFPVILSLVNAAAANVSAADGPDVSQSITILQEELSSKPIDSPLSTDYDLSTNNTSTFNSS